MRLAQTQVLTGKTFEDALSQLGHRDRVLHMIPASELSVDGDTGELLHGTDHYAMTPLAAKQLASSLGIASGYVLRIDNGLAADNYNAFLDNAKGTRQIIVENDTTVVGILGERTVPVPLDTLIESTADRLGHDGYALSSWRYDSQGLTLRTLSDKLSTEPRKGDIIRVGVDMLNRENTESGLSVRGIAERLICLNGMTAAEPLGLSSMIRREGWRDPMARIDIAVNAVSDAVGMAEAVVRGIGQLTEYPLDLSDDPTERMGYMRGGLRGLHPKPITSKPLIETITYAVSQEEPTLYGLMNALTRTGRDSLDPIRRHLFESAGYSLALDPDPVRLAFENVYN